MPRVKPHRYTSHKIFKVRKTSGSRSISGVIKLVYPRLISKVKKPCALKLYIQVDSSTSMCDVVVGLITEWLKEFTEKIELIQEKRRDKIEEFSELIEKELKNSSRKHFIRRRKNHFSRTSEPWKIMKKTAIPEVKLLSYMQNQIQNLLFGERYASWHRSGPPNRLAFC